jgi:hypothetical protein
LHREGRSVHDSIEFSKVSVVTNCVEKDIEACVIKLISTNNKITVLTVYRSPSGNFDIFLEKLDNILNTLHNNKSEFIICGDVNINYLENCDKRQQLDVLLGTNNLKGTANFPTRIVNGSSTAIDNVFIHRSRNYIINPVINELSDHDAQMILISDVMLPRQVCSPQYVRNYSNYNTSKFQELLSFKRWDDVFIRDDANTTFNVFLNTYLKIFYSCFIKKKATPKSNHSPWITCGIRTSCKKKRELHLKLRQDNDPDLKLYYKKYCKILVAVIKEAKKRYYDDAILKSKN